MYRTDCTARLYFTANINNIIIVAIIVITIGERTHKELQKKSTV